MEKRASVHRVDLKKVDGQSISHSDDLLTVEEPLEIRLGYGRESARKQKSISVTMRTPGHDLELAGGFLYTEGIIRHQSEIRRIEYCVNVELPEQEGNVVKVELEAAIRPDLDRLERHFYTTSSCGVCGKSSIEAVEQLTCTVFPEDGIVWKPEMLHAMPEYARQGQTVFRHTGGIHAATLFSQDGQIVCMREDVGRHNAVDKVVGAMLAQGGIPLAGHALLVSGRASFELVQKAVMAGIPLMAAVGAPSSLAVSLARKFNMTLVGFLRDGRFNVYSASQRVLLD